MPSSARIKSSNGRITTAVMPRVAAFAGATGGIGKATVTLVVSKGTPITVYIMGRNEKSHAGFLEELRASNKKATIIWLEGQVTLMADVRRMCDEILSREKSLDLLFLCAGFLAFGGRTETSEGLEASSAVSYWTRAMFTTALLPLLRAAVPDRTTFSPRVISILAAGDESAALPLDDLTLQKPENYGMMNSARTATTMNTVFLARLAEQVENRGVVFLHNHPGVVRTGILTKGWGNNSWAPVVMSALQPLTVLAGAMTPAASAERCLYLITSAEYGGRGVALQQGVSPGRPLSSLKGEADGAGGFFCVNGKIQCFQPTEVMAQIKKAKGDQIVWEKTQEIMGPYI